MHPKPPCPMCGDVSRVKTMGGGTRGLYRYACEIPTCSAEWQEEPPHKRSPSKARKVIMKKSGALRKYRCGVCGALKRGHTCTGSSEEESAAAVEVDTSDSIFQIMAQQPVPFQSYHANALVAAAQRQAVSQSARQTS